MKVKQLVKILEAVDDRLPSDMYDLDNMHHYSKNQDEVVSIADMDVVHFIRAFNHQAHMLNNQVTSDDLIKQNRDLVSANKTIGRKHDSWKEKAMNMVEKSTHEDKLKETISTYNTYLANSMPLESFKKINNQCEELQPENVRLVAQLEHDEHNVGKLDDTVSKDTYQVMWDNCQVLQNERAKLLKESNELKESLRQANLTPTVSTKAYDIAWKNIDELNDQVKRLLDRNAVLSRMYNASLSSNAIIGDVKMFSEIPNTVEGAKLILEMKKYLNRDSYKIRVRGQYLDEETKKTEGWRKYERGQPIEKSKCLRVYVDTKKEVD